VLWLSAALGAIAIAIADTVRGETERNETAVDDLRSESLAVGGLRRGVLYMDWARAHPEIPQFRPAAPFFQFDFPEGQTSVEIIPETAKLNLNQAAPEDLLRLLLNLGAGEARSQEVTAAIVDWRTTGIAGSSPFDGFYGSLTPPYRATHYNFQDVEELLSVKGVTPDLFYGAWQPTPEGSAQRMAVRNGLRDCVSVYGSTDQVDANTAVPAVLAAVGVPPEGVPAIVRERRAQPFVTADDLARIAPIAGPGFARLRVGGKTMFTLRSTARLRLANGPLSDMRRTVAALVKFTPLNNHTPPRILRWYEAAAAGQ
jgi:general secretion pathway protein K